jgi:hypothetical protein
MSDIAIMINILTVNYRRIVEVLHHHSTKPYGEVELSVQLRSETALPSKKELRVTSGWRMQSRAPESVKVWQQRGRESNTSPPAHRQSI